MTDGDYAAILFIVAVLLGIGFVVQLVKAARARGRAADAEAKSRTLESTLTVTRRDAQKKFDGLSVANQELIATNQTIRDQLMSAQREMQTRQEEVRKMKDYVVTSPTRIQHDVSSRLRSVSERIGETVLDDDLRGSLRRELLTVMEKIELHLAADISDFVRERSTDKGVSADNASIWDVMRHIIRVEKYQNVRFGKDEDIRIEGHWIHWDLMLSHVFSNAVEHAKRVDGFVTVAIRKQGNHFAIDITNDGEPIPEKNVERIFDLGFTTKQGGKGVGLYVAQKIAEGLGGRILPPENLVKGRKLFSKRSTAVRFMISNLPRYIEEQESTVAADPVVSKPMNAAGAIIAVPPTRGVSFASRLLRRRVGTAPKSSSQH